MVHSINLTASPANASSLTRSLAVVGLFFEEVADTYAGSTIFDSWDVSSLNTNMVLNFKEVMYPGSTNYVT